LQDNGTDGISNAHSNFHRGRLGALGGISRPRQVRFRNSRSASATIGFVVVWFIAAALNLWVGVSKAGYAFSEELPIFLLIFLAPAVVVALVQWKWR
jgi:hypothetical protein